MFSKTCEYAISAALFIAVASRNGDRLSAEQVADAVDSPKPFMGKILQQLVRDKILMSAKGPGGGFFVDFTAKPVSLYAIVKTIDGHEALATCVLGLPHCSDKLPCPLHDQVIGYRDEVLVAIKKLTLPDLAINEIAVKEFLKALRIRKKRTK
jgi:Rrf2 family protein